MESVIQQAIPNLEVLRLSYPPGERIVEPHTIGYGSSGQILIRGYQTSGASASGEHVHWKLFRLDRMDSVTPTGEKFSGPRDGYKKGDKAMTRGIIEEL